MSLSTLQRRILRNNIHKKAVIKKIKILKNKCRNLGFKNNNKIRMNKTQKIVKKVKILNNLEVSYIYYFFSCFQINFLKFET